MKKNIFFFLVIAVLLVIAIACSKSTPSESASDAPGENTATATPINEDSTATHTNTMTHTDTSTPTATPTTTSTNTPGVKLDDFEDANRFSAVSCADCNNELQVGGNPGVNYGPEEIVATGGHGLLGNYYYSVSGSVKEDAATAISLIINSYKNQSSNTGVNGSLVNNIKFDYKLSADAEMKTRVYVYNDLYGDGIYYDLNLLRDNVWHSTALEFASFGGSIDNILPNVTRMFFQIRTQSSAAPAQDDYFEFCVDNIRLEN
jgi:hypothetical protein